MSRTRPVAAARPSRRLGAGVALLVTLVVVLMGARPVAAHTELEASTPTAEATVSAPVAEITLDFTADVGIVDGGYEVLDPQGQVRRPDAVEQPGPDVVLLRFATPFSGGAVGVRWSVNAADGHVIEGAFSFTVDAPAPVAATTTTATPATTTTAPATTTTAPATTTTAPATTTTARATTTTVRATTTIASTTAPVDTAPPATPSSDPPVATSEPDATVTTTIAPITLEEFLGRSSSRSSDLTVRRIAQVVGVVGALLALGWVGFVALLAPVRRVRTGLLAGTVGAGVGVVVGTFLEAVSQAGVVTGRGLGVAGSPADVLEALGPSYRTAIILRLLGGVVIAGAALAWRRSSGRPVVVAAAIGAAAVVVSFTFDGHTVSKGVRPVQVVADIVHVAAAAGWLGGVTALLWWAWRRRHWTGASTAEGGQAAADADGSGDDGFLATFLRFSGLAAWLLLSVAIAGGVMTLGIIDGLGDLTGTTWGRVLLFKLAAVLFAVAIGAYHRFALLPALQRQPDDEVVRERVTDALAAEAFLLAIVAVLAGILVGSQV